MTHTPGPWSNNGGRIEAPSGDYAIEVVATVGVVNEQTPINTANARLIAAAPEMLAALRASVALVERMPNYAPIALAPAGAGMLAMARAAIAKAGGQQ